MRRLFSWLERFSLALETPIVRWVGSPQFNPLYHTGTITIFLLLVILVTGIYLTLFYPFGFEASYRAVAGIEANLFGRLMRALHRYASDAAVVVALLHGWRTFFQDRFRGPRWLAWVTGIAMAVFVWAIGVTGYWLVWDQRAQLINQALVNLVGRLSAGQAFLVRNLIHAAEDGLVFVAIVISLHIGLSALVGLFIWLHIKRLSRPKLLPPRFWMGMLIGLLLFVGIFLPVLYPQLGLLPPIDRTSLPGRLPVDFFYLFYLAPALGALSTQWWAIFVLVLVALALFPWLLAYKLPKPVVVDTERCTGCTLCAADCPYKALRMAPRSDGKKHKYVAELDPALCVACGICIGTCSPQALALPVVDAIDLPEEAMNWQTAVAQAAGKGQPDASSGEAKGAAWPVRVVFTCQRHASQGARAYLSGARDHEQEEISADDPLVILVPVSCIGKVHPDQVVEARQAGAAQVQFVGCPPEDCAQREGNLWMHERLRRVRLPKLRLSLADMPIFADWLAPNDFTSALRKPGRMEVTTAYSFRLTKKNWTSLLPALGLLALALCLTLLVGVLPYQAYPDDQALVEVVMAHRGGYPLEGQDQAGTKLTTETMQRILELDPAVRLILEIDGQATLDRSYLAGGSGHERKSRAYEQVWLKEGDHHLRLLMYDLPGQSEPKALFDGQVALEPGQVMTLNLLDQVVGGDPVEGKRLYDEASLGVNAGCRICHSLEEGVTLVGPSFAGVASRAVARVPGMTAEEYLRQSILDPNAYIVPGFPANQMVNNLDEVLTEQQIEDLVAFLLTLK